MPTTLNLFISYAREDENIADAVRAALTKALPTPLAYVEMDKYTIEMGVDFATNIQEKLDRAHVLILVHTARPKLSFGWTGQELGYFRAQKKLTPTLDDIERRIVFVSLADAPPGTEMLNGVRVTISSEDLDRSQDEYALGLKIGNDDAFVRFLNEMQGVVEDIWRKEKYQGTPPTRERNPVECTKDMYVEIFRSQKAGEDVARSTRPQKQLTIETSDSELQAWLPDLPPTALMSAGSAAGTMTVFGLPEGNLTWKDFCAQTQGRKNGGVWTDAIRAVVTSTLPDQISVDNGQVIFANDDGKMYRVILTSGLRYFDGTRKFTIYLVEGLRRTEFGREETSLLLKGLELVCRYRFMFLEADSPFIDENIEVTPPDKLYDRATSAMRELDWLKRDARHARLDDTVVWGRMLGGYELVKKIALAYGANEPAVMAAALAIIKSRREPDKLPDLRAKLAAAVRALADATNEVNREMMVCMMDRLRRYVDEESMKVDKAAAD